MDPNKSDSSTSELLVALFLPALLIFPFSMLAAYTIGFPIFLVGVVTFESTNEFYGLFLTILIVGIFYGGFGYLGAFSMLGYTFMKRLVHKKGMQIEDSNLVAIWSFAVAIVTVISFRLLAISFG